MDGLSAKIDKLSSLKIDRSVSELIRIKKSIGVKSPTARELTRLDKVIQIAALSTDVNPTEEQRRTGNYRKGRFSMKGMTFVIENPRGSVRSGVGKTSDQLELLADPRNNLGSSASMIGDRNSDDSPAFALKDSILASVSFDHFGKASVALPVELKGDHFLDISQVNIERPDSKVWPDWDSKFMELFHKPPLGGSVESAFLGLSDIFIPSLRSIGKGPHLVAFVAESSLDGGAGAFELPSSLGGTEAFLIEGIHVAGGDVKPLSHSKILNGINSDKFSGFSVKYRRLGKPWSIKMKNHYGYVLKTRSDADGDHLDVSIGPDPSSRKVFAIDQQNRDGDFDEHKFMVGFLDEKAARQAYEDSFSDAAPFQGMVELSWDEFKEWIEFGDSSAPIVDQMLRTFNSRIQLMKSTEERDGAIYLYGACMVPNLIDRSKFRDYYDEDDVRQAARAYLVKSRAAGFRHQAIFNNEDVQLTQSFIAPMDMDIGGKNIPKGSWVTEFKLIHPEVIRMAKAGELAAFSIGGPSRKWRLEKRDGTAQSRWFGPGGDDAN